MLTAPILFDYSKNSTSSPLSLCAAGIVLGLLYNAVPSKHTLLEQLSHGTLIRMSAADLWIDALKVRMLPIAKYSVQNKCCNNKNQPDCQQLFGPAPSLPVIHRTHRAPTVDAFFDPVSPCVPACARLLNNL
jgi:hypothetical protein